jgi:hypothetical protein
MKDRVTDGRVYELPKAQLFRWIGYEIYSPDVVDFHESKARTRIVSAPARTSKSYSAAAEMLYDCFPTWTKDAETGERIYLDSRILWCVGPDYGTIKEFDYLFEWLVTNREKYGFSYRLKRSSKQKKKGDLQIYIEWGRDPQNEMVYTLIEGKSAERETSLQGEEIYSCVMSEAAEQPRHILNKYLATRCHHLILPTTPKPHADWIRELIDMGEKDPGLSIDHFHYAIDFEHKVSPNPKFDWKRFEAAMRRAASISPTGRAEDDPHFAEQFLGLWVYYAGKVLPFRHEKGVPGRFSHVVNHLPADFEQLNKFVSVDYGHDHRAAALFHCIMQCGTVIVYDEIVDTGLHPGQFVDLITQRLRQWEHEPEYFVGDPSRPEVATLMRELGLPVWDRGSKNALRDRAAGTLRIIDMLADDELLERPKLFVHSRCVELIGELKVLRRKEDYGSDEFAKSSFDPACDDDCFDALRYGVQSMPRPELGPKEKNWWEAYGHRPGGNYWTKSRDMLSSYDGIVLPEVAA